jgi:predicted hydrocarbon binding protein
LEGIVFLGLRKFVRERLGGPTWRAVQSGAGLADRIYMPLQKYPAEELVDILAVIADETDATVASVLEDYGEFIAPDLLRTYATIIDPRWKLLDIVERSHGILGQAVLLRKTSDALSTSIRGLRVSDREASLTYASPQRLCAMVRGALRGIAGHVGEAVVIGELRCMLRGHRQCEIRVRTASAPPSMRLANGMDPPPSSRSWRLSVAAAAPDSA